MRVREVITRSGKRIRVKFPSRKLNRMIHCESPLERDAAYHFEYHPLVNSYQEQPSVEYYYDAAGVQHRYYPDFRINFKDGSVLLIEIKPARYLTTKKVRDQLKYVAARFAEQKRPFRVMTETDIRREPLFGNLKKMHKANKLASELVPTSVLLTKLAGGPSWLFGKLSNTLDGVNKLLRLVRSNHLQVDLESPLSSDAMVWLPNTQGGTKNGSFHI
jgi:TnsA endonuclease N terminal